MPPLRLDPDFITQHNQLLQRERERIGMIQANEVEQAKAQRMAKRAGRLQKKYPWLRPRVAAVFAQVREPDEDVMQAFQNEWKRKGMKVDPETLDAMEKYVATSDFAAQVKVEEGKPSGVRARKVQKRFEEQFSGGGGGFGIGDVVDYIAEIPSHLPGGVERGPGSGEPVIDVAEKVPGLKPAIRGAFTALESPAQEVQGYLTDEILKTAGTDVGLERAAAASESPYSDSGQVYRRRGGERLGVDVDVTGFRARSTGGIALGAMLRGDPIPDSGTGFLPGGELREEQMQRARQAASIDGRAATPGRILASTVVEPGTKPYNTLSGLTDAAIVLGADPTNLALSGAGAAAKARHVIRPDDVAAHVGGFQSTFRRFVDGPTAKEFLDSKDGANLVAYLGDETSALRLNQRTNWKLPAEVQSKVLGTTDQAEIRGVLDEALGSTIREAPNPFTAGAQYRTGQSRWSMLLPEHHVSINRKEHMMEQFYRALKHDKVPDAEIDEVLHEVLPLSGRAGQYEAMRVATTAAEKSLVARGIPKHEARQVLKIGTDDLGNDAHDWYIKEIGERTAMGRQIDVGDAPLELSSAHLPVEHMNHEAVMWSTASVDRLLAKYEPLWKLPRSNGVRNAASASVTFLEGIQNQVWKPLVLLRGAWTARVVGEEQLRMAASGLTNAFSHPIRHIGVVAMGARDKELRSSPEFANMLAKRGKRLYNDTGERVVASGKKAVTWENDPYEFAQAWADEIITLHSDELSRLTAQAQVNGTLDNLKQGFADGELTPLRRELSQNRANTEALADGNRAGSDYFIDTVVTRNRMAAGEDQRFLSTIADGKYDAGDEVGELAVKPGGPRSIYGRNALTVDRDFTTVLGSATPPEITQLPWDVTRAEPGSFVGRTLDRSTDFMFAALGSYPTNLLSRSPTFTNFYWNEVERLMPYMDEATRSVYIKRAHDTGTFKVLGKEFDPTGIHKRLNQAHVRAHGAKEAGTVGEEAADDLARSFALDSTKDLLYDLNRRSQFFEATQLLFPFGNAWQEVLTRWAKIGMENPKVIRRGQVFIEGARESNPFEVLPEAMIGPYSAGGDPSRQGFFYQDLDTGEEVFTYPWSAKVAEMLPFIGVPIPMVGRAQGLNLALQVMPGVGLAVQLPANWAMNRWMEDPKWDPLRELISPYGIEEAGPDSALNIVSPPWLQKVWTSFAPWNPETRPGSENARLLNNTIEDIAAYYISSGEFSPKQVAEAHDKAEDTARWLYRFRATFQWGAPSAPSPKFVLEDKHGKLVRFGMARDAYYKLFEKDPDSATEKFMERFGEDWLYATAPKTISETYNAPVTKKALDWVLRNPEVAKKYPLTHGMFAPEGGEFDYDAYMRQLATGQRAPVSAKERWEGVNHMLGTIWYDRLRQQRGLEKGEEGSLRQRRELADAEALIMREYPGYKQTDLRASSIPEAITELAAATGDTKLPEGVRTAIATYLAERQAAMRASEKGGSVTHADQPAYAVGKRNRGIRDELRNQAAILVDRYPKFAPFWQRIFSRELQEEE